MIAREGGRGCKPRALNRPETLMPDTLTPVESHRGNLNVTPVQVSVGPQPPRAPMRHVLEFEKPLAKLEAQILELEALQQSKNADYTKELRQLRNNYTSLLRKTYDKLSAWETVQVARHPQRPLFKDYQDMICREFRELHGDRLYGEEIGRASCRERV